MNKDIGTIIVFPSSFIARNCLSGEQYGPIALRLNFPFFDYRCILQVYMCVKTSYINLEYFVAPNTKGQRPMFLIRMCLGDVYLTGSGGGFRRPPCKKCSNPTCTTHQALYDSVVANGGAFSDREFVVYDRNQTYPEYIIWYT